MNQSDKNAFIFWNIFSLANRLQTLGDKLDDNISIKQWLVIAIISKHEFSSPTLGDLAQAIGTSRQNIKKIALILEEKGFVFLSKDAGDARAIRMNLTPKCIAYFQDRSEIEIQFMDKLFNGFSETLTDGLYKGFIKLGRNINEMENSDEST